MPSNKTPGLVIRPITITEQGKPKCVGFKVSGELFFTEHFGDNGQFTESEGASYTTALRARGVNGNLAKELLTWDSGKITGATSGYDTQPYIDGPDDAPRLYVLTDGTLTPDKDHKRTVRIAHKATAHTDYTQIIKDPNIVWPDGLTRKIRVAFKANEALTGEEFVQRQQATQERRASGMMKGMTPEQLGLMTAGTVIARLKSIGKGREEVLDALNKAHLPVPSTFDAEFPPVAAQA